MKPLGVFAPALLAFAFASGATAETTNCTPITAVPAVINSFGTYCLTQSFTTLMSKGAAITINVQDVVLDLNGFKLDGRYGGAATTAVGILSSVPNVTVKNGTVRGFYRGVSLLGRGSIVRDLLVDSNRGIGIEIDGAGSVAEHNRVIATGGSTVTYSEAAFGILVRSDAAGARVIDNLVSGLDANNNGNEYGIWVLSHYAIVRNNDVSDAQRPPGGTSIGIGQWKSTVTGNTVANFTWCLSSNQAGFYTNNTLYECDANYYGAGTVGAGNSP